MAGNAGPAVAIEGGTHGAVDQAIAIVAQRGVAARTEFHRRVRHAADDDVVGEEAVGRMENAAGRQRRFDEAVGGVAERVNPGIGASGGAEDDWLSEHFSQHALQLALERGGVGLPLPALIARSVIFEVEKKISFHVSGFEFQV